MRAIIAAAVIVMTYTIGYTSGQEHQKSAPIPPGWSVKEVK